MVVQIKSGDSYVTPNGEYILQGDKDHFEYWYNHILPVAAIIYSPTRKEAVWFDVTEYLSQNFQVVENGPYNIKILAEQEFCSSRFHEFQHHFISRYLEPYKHKLGVALERFSNLGNRQGCRDGIEYLFSFQRQNATNWYYIISCFQNFRKHSLIFNLINKIAYLTGHGDTFWHKDNFIEKKTEETASSFLVKRFGKVEIVCMLEVLTDGGGFARGAIGQPIESIIRQIEDRDKILESIISDLNFDEEVRYWALLLSAFYLQSQKNGLEKCLKLINQYISLLSDENDELKYMASGIRHEIEMNRSFYLFC
jgi:hypothetical protein